MEKVDLLNIQIDSVALGDLLKNLNKGVLVTPNVDHLVKLQKDEEFLECYKAADWIICDSNIVQLALKFLGTPVQDVIPGSSFLPAFYTHHRSNTNIKIFLLGGGPDVPSKAMSNINNKVGRRIVVGSLSPSYGFEKDEAECDEIVNIINRSGANVLVVGVGAPKQEKWIMKYRNRLSSIDLFMALGATLDFEAGNISRAPQILQKLHLEWLYRLVKEPKRLWKRYLIDDMAFFKDVINLKLGLYKDPFR